MANSMTCSTVDAALSSLPVPASPLASSPLVLIADDEPTARLLLRKAMQKENFRVIEACDGEECLDLCRQHRPDIVLMDAMMPKMDGFSCCAALQTLPEHDAPPVLMITSLDDRDSIERIFAVGAADYIAKPIHWTLLQQRVRRLQDILKRRQAESRIKASLKEKEALLKEVHHRVKNNLQIISSLLNLQLKSIKDPQILDIFKESQNRVRLMALIHEKLYQSHDLSKINLKDYIESLASNLLRSYEVNQSDIRLIVEADDIALEADTAVSCGLIINELVSNSLKYAFPLSKDPDPDPGLTDLTGSTDSIKRFKESLITIKAKKTDGNHFSICCQDNGIGLPEAIDIQSTKTLGLQLVSSLTEQLGGVLNIIHHPGTSFELTGLQSLQSNEV